MTNGEWVGIQIRSGPPPFAFQLRSSLWPASVRRVREDKTAMPRRLCLEPGCPNPATSRGRCDQHRKSRERERSRRRRADPDKGARIKLYHSKKWLMTRKHVLAKQPLCTCGLMAQEVDHIVPLSEGGAPYALDNLQPLCSDCHRDKHRGEGR